MDAGAALDGLIGMQAPRAPGRRVPRLLAILSGSLLLALSPAVAAAAQAWSISASPSSLVVGRATAVTVVAKNLSGSSGGGEGIGCVIITMPSSFVIASVSILSVPSGYSWSSSFVNGATPTVSLQAAADPDRLLGTPFFESITVRVTVTSSVTGAASWTGNEFNKPKCTGGFGLPLTMPFLTTLPPNQPPVASDDSFSATEGSPRSVPAPGVLANDTDPEGSAITALLASAPTHGALALQPTGAFTYMPNAGFAGTDTFTYRASDGAASSAPATVTLFVAAVATPTPSPNPATSTPGPSSTASPTPTPLLGTSQPPADSPTPTPGAFATEPASLAPGSTPRPTSVGTPQPTPALSIAGVNGGPDDPISPISLDFAFAGMSFDWFIPGLAIGVPGLLVIAAIALQFAGALVWLPAVRRLMGGSDRRRSRRPT